MKNNQVLNSVSLRIVLVIFIAILYAGCTRSPELYILDISGGQFAWNVLRSSDSFCSTIEEGNTNVSVPVMDGDLLYLFTGTSDEDIVIPLIYKFDINEGTDLSISADSSGFIYNHNKLISICLDNENGWEKIKETEDQEFINLHSLMISLQISEDQLSVLERISKINPNVGLFIENADTEKELENILSLFDPVWLMIADSDIEDPTGQYFSLLSNLEILVYDGSSDLDYLKSETDLHTLILMSWDPEMNKDLNFNSFTNLELLKIENSPIVDFSMFKDLKNLKGLFLVDCDSLLNIDLLTDFSELHSLGFTACDNISNISHINEIASLSWFSFPSNVDQGEFAEILEFQNSLEAIELVDCKKIVDLQPVVNLGKIKAIGIQVSTYDYSPLYSLNTLELVLLPSEDFEEHKEEVKSLKDALPEARVLPGQGFCLGSGWLLLLIPMILLFRFIKIKK